MNDFGCRIIILRHYLPIVYRLYLTAIRKINILYTYKNNNMQNKYLTTYDVDCASSFINPVTVVLQVRLFS